MFLTKSLENFILDSGFLASFEKSENETAKPVLP